MQPTDIFPAGSLALRAVERIDTILSDDSVSVVTTKSQVAFRRSRGFAYVWRPAQWHVAGPEAVLSIALGRRLRSDRFREVVHPSPGTWMHHLALSSVTDIDDEVRQWLIEARDAAA